MKLTKTAIDQMIFNGAKPTASDIRWDDQLKGFGVRVYPTGRKVFLIRYRINGRKRYFSIGVYGHITLHQAREIAMKKFSEVIDGNDPIENRREVKRSITFSGLVSEYIERYAKPRKKSWKRDKQRLENHAVKEWPDRLAISIKKSDVSLLHNKIGVKMNKPVLANRTLDNISKVFDCGIEWGYLPEDMVNPCSRVVRFKEYSRERFVSHDEMPRLAQAIEAEPNVYIRSLFWLYLLTGLRRDELRTLTWAQVNLSTKELRIGKTKNGKPHLLPLSDPAIEIFNQIPQQFDNPYVFCGYRAGKALGNTFDPWDRIRKKAGIEDVWIHDLRRTVGSWLAQSGASLPLIGKILNHSNPSSTAIYSRFSQTPIRDALEGHAAQIKAFTPMNEMSSP